MEERRQRGREAMREILHTPEGVRDCYGAEFARKKSVTEAIGQVMRLYGYEDIQTPTFEFFDVFSNEIGTTPSRELYKFFDKEGNTLVLRPDFTPSVVRCVAKYYMDETAPLRFCYSGSVYTNSSSLQGKLKETTQMGAEFMNDGGVQADAEMVAMLTEGLLAAGLTRFRISVGNVEYFKGLCEETGLDGETELLLRDAISGKNFFAAEDLLKSRGIAREDRERFLKITDFMNTEEDLRAVLAAARSERCAAALERLIALRRLLEDYGVSDYVGIDLSLLSKYRYYTGIIFKGYTYGTGDAIATGGRYDRLLSYFGKDAPAIGFVVQIDALTEAMARQQIPAPAAEEVMELCADEAHWTDAVREAASLRKQGRAVRLVRRQ